MREEQSPPPPPTARGRLHPATDPAVPCAEGPECSASVPNPTDANATLLRCIDDVLKEHFKRTYEWYRNLGAHQLRRCFMVSPEGQCMDGHVASQALKVFHSYTRDVDNLLADVNSLNPILHAHKLDTLADLQACRLRIPVACTTGRPGKVMTSLLNLVGQHFVNTHHGGAAVLATFDDKDPIPLDDECCRATTRMCHRLLIAAGGVLRHGSEAGAAQRFVDSIIRRVVGTAHGDLRNPSTRSEWESFLYDVNIAAVVRCLLRMGPDQDLLILVDGLRALDPDVEDTKVGIGARQALSYLGAITQQAARKRFEAQIQGAHRLGMTYVVGSGLNIQDPSRCLTVCDSRPMCWLPVPPNV